MVAIMTAYVDVRPDTAKFGPLASSGIKKGLGKTGETSGKSWGGSFMKSAGAAIAAVGLITIGKKVLDAAAASGVVIRQTNAVIKSTGDVSHVSAKGVSELASSIMEKTGVDKLAVQSGENMLLTFTNIHNQTGKNNDIFNQASKTLIDMSAALNGGNVTSETARKQAIQLGKALNDPVKGMTALKRVGVTFTDEQVKQVKAMEASGNKMGAQKLILRELNKEFGGSAEASATTTKKLSAMMSEMAITLGSALLPIVSALIKYLMPALQSFSTWMTGTGVPVITNIAKHVFPLLTGVIKDLFTGVTTIVDAFAGLPGPLKLVIAGIGALVVAFSLYNVVLAFTAALNPFQWVVIGIAAVVLAVGLIKRNWSSIFPVLQAIGHWFNVWVLAPIQAVWRWVAKNWPLLLAILTGPIGIAVLMIMRHWRSILSGVSAVFTWVRHNWPLLLAILTGPVGLAVLAILRYWRSILTGVRTLITNIRNAFSGAVNWLVSAGRNVVSGLFSGMISAARAAGNWVHQIGNDILNAVKNFFGIHSPSTVMAGVGEHLISGLMQGMVKANPIAMVKKIFGSMPKALMGLMGKGLLDVGSLPGKALSALGNMLGSLFGGGSGSGASAYEAYAQSLMPAFGWGPGQMSALIPLWMGESGWNPAAYNASSGATGIPQSLPGSKMASEGADWRTSAFTQIRWGLKYIAQVYGSPAATYAAWLSRSPHWYGAGGIIREPIMGIGRSGRMYGFGEKGPETVVPGTGGGKGNTYHINVSVPPNANKAELGSITVDAIRAYERGNGAGWRS